MAVELRPLQARSIQSWFYSASWYQGMYLAAAHRHHWATRENAHEHSSDKEIVEALVEADVICRRLLLVAATTLDGISEDSAGLEAEIRTKDERRALRTFLDDIVEASAAILLAGIRVELGFPFESVAGDSFFPAPRGVVINELTEEEVLGRPMLKPGWLVRYADAGSNVGRVEYNLACFYACLAWRERRRVERSTLEMYLGESAEHLRRAFERLPYKELQVLAPWVPKDPSLRGLRDLDKDAFKRVTSLLNRVSAPKQKEQKKRPLWRRPFSWVRQRLKK